MELLSATIIPERLHHQAVLLFLYCQSIALYVTTWITIDCIHGIITLLLNSSERQIACPGVVNEWTCILICCQKTIWDYRVEEEDCSIQLQSQHALIRFNAKVDPNSNRQVNQLVDNLYVSQDLVLFVPQMGRPPLRSGNV